MLLHVLTNIVFLCDIVPKIQLKTANNTAILTLKCRHEQITGYASTRAY